MESIFFVFLFRSLLIISFLCERSRVAIMLERFLLLLRWISDRDREQLVRWNALNQFEQKGAQMKANIARHTYTLNRGL